ncbi:hypothetical protein [Sphingobacterium kitahiroshimense]|uniref:hypothetical protein n=1 Tax=Sphingobacterium kitahiroshimense TaxID=470446 RepID=UPI003208B692
MESDKFLKLIELLERESAARVASEAARISENLVFQQTILDMQASNQQIIQQLNTTIGILMEEIRLLKGPKKNSHNSSIPPSKDENRSVKKTNSLRKPSGKKPGGREGHGPSVSRGANLSKKDTETQRSYLDLSI